jgi:serine phosphatase RsbU (regulator of sigma subunit)/coenzyme F420-reducing hydrogenase delta subunit
MIKNMNSKKEKLLKDTYETFIQTSLADLPLEDIHKFIDEEFTGYGTALNEKLLSISDYRELVVRQRNQGKDINFEFASTPITRKIIADGNSALFVDEITISMLVNNESNEMLLRLSTVLEYREEKWIVIHFHGSKPEYAGNETDPWHVDEWKQKNAELEKLVKERTEDLIQKNRELEIESSLERVRAVAMGMNKPDDLLSVCEVSFKELTSLGFNNIRNSIIHLFSNTKDQFTDYDYSDYNKGAITVVDNKFHQVVEKYLKQIKIAKDAFVEIVIDGKKLTDWKKFRKKIGDYDDPRLDNIDALHYYFYSIGSGALGISNFNALSEEELLILKRFRNVFELAYQRYNDIALAESQAREAQIEVALERVRSRTMAMYDSNELLEAVAVFFQQFKSLGLLPAEARTYFCHIYTDTHTAKVWMTHIDGKVMQGSHITPLNKSASMKKYYEAWKRKEPISIRNYAGKALTDYMEFLLTLPHVSKDEGYRHIFKDPPERIVMTDANFLHGNIGVMTFEPLSQEALDTLVRFAKVFELTYTRFLDLQKAEAQAREAQIEVALERVRSKTMAMHNSHDVGATVVTLFDEVLKLGLDKSIRCGIGILEGSEQMETWSATSYPNGEVDLKMGMLDMTIHPMLIGLKKAWKSGETGYSYQYIGNDVIRYYNALNNEPEYPFHVELDTLPEKEFHNSFFFSEGILFAFTANPLSEEAAKVLNRFASVFGQTYRRYLDLQKAEAQAREAQIEAALERVRARTMAMHNSDELADTASHLFSQLKELGINPYRCNIGIIDAENDKCQLWSTTNEGDVIPLGTFIPLTETPSFINIYAAWKKKLTHSVMKLVGKDRLEMIKYFIQFMPYAEFKPEEMTLEKISQVTSIFNIFNFKQGFINIHTNSEVSEPDINVIQRFTKVFEQTYTRFLDLIKAEEQAQEAQIELGLERVRARAMAMQNSNELSELVDTVFKELTKLDFALSWCIINIIDESSLSNMVWAANPNIDKAPDSYHMKFEDYPFHDAMMKGYKERATKYIYVLEGIEKKVYDEYLFKETEFRKVPEEAQAASRAMEKYVCSFTFSNFGGLQTVGEEPLSDENLNILSRFGKVFDLTYTRFNDLKQAEAQAREAQIEAALERVRSRSMGMQKSEELKEVIKIVYQQLTYLKINLDHSGFVVDYTPGGDWHFWIADEQQIPSKITHPYFESVWANQFNEAKEKGADFFTTNLNFEEKNKFYNELLSYIPGLPEASKDFYLSCPGLAALTVMFDNVSLYIENFSGIPYSEEDNKTLMRFGKVFQQTYTRFLDLQNAEAQAREAQIEAALERVRASAMAMHSSEDLALTVDTFFSELNALNVTPHRCGVGIVDAESRTTDIRANTTTHNNEIKRIAGKLKLSGHPVLDSIFENWKMQKEYHPVLHGNEIIDYYKVMDPQVKFPDFADDETQYGYYFYFKEGGVFAWTDKELAEGDLQIFRRYTSVLSLTYRRYIDLKEAEAQAREAQIEAALERVRAKAMAMHKSDDLTSAVETVFTELEQLGLKTIRCGIGIFDGQNRKVNVWTSLSGDKDRSVQVSGDEVLEGHPLLDGIYESWQNQVDYSYRLEGKDLTDYYNTVSQTNLHLPEQEVGQESPEEYKQYYHGVMFPAGGLYAFRDSEFSDEAKKLMTRFADVFHLTFTRHLDLKEAEAKNKIIQAEDERKTQELEEARKLQLAMLPKELPKLPDLDIAVYMKTATEVGGDYYDFKVGYDGTLTTIIGDATGHGMKAGTVVTITKSLFNSMAANENILSTFDKISEVIKGMKFRQLAMCLIMMKIKGNRLSMSSAAMPPALIYRAKTKAVEEIFLKGMPLGTMKKFPYKKIEGHLNSGDRILLYSDGLPELAKDNNEMYGYDRIKTEFLSVGEKEPEEIVNHLKNSASKWVDGKEPDDDVTFVVIKVK